MARAATETQKAGLTGLEFGLAIPGTVGGAVWANAGRARRATSRASSSRPASSLADGTEAIARPRPTSGFGYRDSRFKHAARRRGRRSVVIARRSGSRRPTPTRSRRGLDEIRRWRQAHQPLGHPVGRQRRSATRPATRPAA